MTAANYQSMIASTLGVSAAIAGKIAAQYPLSRYPSPPVALGAVGTDAIFACHALTAEQSLARYVPTYAYEFNDENAPELFLPPVGFPYGAAHASELPYLFSQTAVAHPVGLSAAQQQLAAAMKQDWTNLAKTGIPAAGWPRSPHQPADAVPGPARPAGRDGLRRPAPLRVLGARTLEIPWSPALAGTPASLMRRPAAKGSGWIGAPGDLVHHNPQITRKPESPEVRSAHRRPS